MPRRSRRNQGFDPDIDQESLPSNEDETFDLGSDIEEFLFGPNMSGPNAPAPTATVTGAPEQFKTNPYCADINPCTNVGSRLYKTATDTLDKDEKIFPNMSNAKKFMKMLNDDAQRFGWGSITNNIMKYDANGAPLKDNATTPVEIKHSLLEDYKSAKLTVDEVRIHTSSFYLKGLALDEVQKNKKFPELLRASQIDPANDADDKKMYYNRVRLNMIGERLRGILTEKAWTQLLNKSNKFKWTEADGSTILDGCTMLMILVTESKPTTRVGITNLKDKIRATKMSNHSYNVKEMCEHISNLYSEILLENGTHDDIEKDLFSSLLTGKNEEFHAFIQTKKTTWEMGEDMSPDEIATEAVTKYNNLVQQSQWKNQERKDAKFAALTNELKTLKAVFATAYSNSNSNSHSNRSNSNSTWSNNIEDWRKKKSFGTSTEKNGKTWHWCSKHKSKDYDGLYVCTHKESDHDEFYANKKKQKEERKNNSSSSNKSGGNKLYMKDSLKTAMVTQLGMSTEDAEKFWSDVASSAN